MPLVRQARFARVAIAVREAVAIGRRGGRGSSSPAQSVSECNGD
jgi:hypothetical protein